MCKDTDCNEMGSQYRNATWWTFCEQNLTTKAFVFLRLRKKKKSALQTAKALRTTKEEAPARV